MDNKKEKLNSMKRFIYLSKSLKNNKINTIIDNKYKKCLELIRKENN